jgi:hypothetical protein
VIAPIAEHDIPSTPVPVVTVDNERTLVELTSSPELIKEARLALALRTQAHSMLDDAAHLASVVRNRMQATGRKTFYGGGIKVSFVPESAIFCTCHNADVHGCPSAKASVDTHTYVMQLEPKLRIEIALPPKKRSAA